ncbi:MAG TPA: HAD family phosphatase [Planctomycetota bacterium]|nr:HAD family phosphatase [Planctomycetota bacterium]
MTRRSAAPRFAGAIFDLDGTLTDNMALHQRAFEVFLSKHGLPPLTLELRRRLDGKRNRDIFPILFARELDDVTQRAFADEKESLYRELSRGRLSPLRGLRELLALLGKARVPSAIATSAPLENVDHTLKELGLAEFFRVVARADDVPHGKPHPDVFLLAAKRLGVAPERCVAFEDAPVGIESARRAGMTCVALTTSFAAGVFTAHASAPHHVVRDYAEFLAGPGRDIGGSEGRR